MKNSLLGGVALVALAVGDRAMADRPAARPWDWTGFYLGGDIGAQWTHVVWTAISLRDLPGVQQPGWSSLGIDASSPSEFDLSGARIGSHVGYNYQFAPRWVAGIEVDFGYAKRTENAIGFPGCTITCNAFLGTPLSEPAAGGDVTSVGIRWDASVRARLGYLATPEVLVFATGGLAWQNIQATGLCGDWHTSNYCFGPGPGFGQPVPSFVTQSTTRTGLTVAGELNGASSGTGWCEASTATRTSARGIPPFLLDRVSIPSPARAETTIPTGLGSARKLTSRLSASLTSSIEGGCPRRSSRSANGRNQPC